MKKAILWLVVVPLLLVFTAPLYSNLSGYNSMATSNDAGIRADILAVSFSPTDDEAFVNPPSAQPAILLLLGIGLVGLAGVSRKGSKLQLSVESASFVKPTDEAATPSHF